MVCLNVPNTSVSFTTYCVSHFIFQRCIDLSDYFLWADPYFSLIHVMFSIGAVMLLEFFLGAKYIFAPREYIVASLSSFLHKKQKESSFFNIFVTVVQVEKVHRMHLGLFSVRTSSETSVWYKIMCCISGYLRLSFFTVWMLYYFLFSPNSLPPSLFNSRQTQGALNESDDPETGCLTDNKPTSRHFYPVALLLVSSHLLVVWLILSLALLLAKYQ